MILTQVDGSREAVKVCELMMAWMPKNPGPEPRGSECRSWESQEAPHQAPTFCQESLLERPILMTCSGIFTTGVPPLSHSPSALSHNEGWGLVALGRVCGRVCGHVWGREDDAHQSSLVWQIPASLQCRGGGPGLWNLGCVKTKSEMARMPPSK